MVRHKFFVANAQNSLLKTHYKIMQNRSYGNIKVRDIMNTLIYDDNIYERWRKRE